MSLDTDIRAAERVLASDPTAWRPVLTLLLRADRAQEALAMLEATEGRIHEAGKGLGRASWMEAISGATDRAAARALTENATALLRVSDARLALENDIALGRYGRMEAQA